MHAFEKSNSLYVSSCSRGCCMKNFRFDTICNITQEPPELQRHNTFVHVGSLVSLLLQTTISWYQKNKGKSHFDQLASASSCTPP